MRAALAAHLSAREEGSWRPVIFRPYQEDDRGRLLELLRNDARRIQVFDNLLDQIRDLIRTRHPGTKITAADLETLSDSYLNGADVEEFGTWVYYPWSGRLVHLLDEEDFAELRTNRNRYKIVADEQATLATRRIGIVGLSVGQSVALTLALERSFGELRLADFDTVDLSNLNRIRAGVHNLGVPKVYVTAREIAEIDPYLDVKVFPEGVTPDSVGTFLVNDGKLDVVVEECDSLDIKILLRHEARRHRIPVVMETSDRGMIDIERFDLEPERPVFHGLVVDLNPDTLRGLTPEQKLPYVLRILGSDMVSDRARASMIEIEQTISTWPQLGAEVAHGGAAAAHAVRRITLGQIDRSGRFFLDLDDFGPSRLPETATQVTDSVPLALPSLSKPSRVSDPLMRDLVSQAALAPSGGNSQPWQWRVSGQELHLLLDQTRSYGLADFEAAGSYVALGCAAENLILSAHKMGREVRLYPLPDEDRPEHAATLTLTGPDDVAAEAHWGDELQAQIPLRHTCRTIGPRRPLAPADRDALTAAVRSFPLADIQWVTEEPELAQVGELLGAADRLRILHPQCHREMFHEIRWTRHEAESTRDGIDVATLGLSPTDLAGLEMCRHWASLELVRQWGGGRNLEKMSRKFVAASSAVALITMPLARSVDYFNGGRALQRMWLRATARRLAVHPMACLPYFLARVTRANGEGFDQHMIAELRAIRPIYERVFKLSGPTADVILFRISYNDATEKRSLRRPLDDVLLRA
jgi:molybdopterin/thiamine biosynthesis adenylyltransferase